MPCAAVLVKSRNAIPAIFEEGGLSESHIHHASNKHYAAALQVLGAHDCCANWDEVHLVSH
jgi:hypothetical protein